MVEMYKHKYIAFLFKHKKVGPFTYLPPTNVASFYHEKLKWGLQGIAIFGDFESKNGPGDKNSRPLLCETF